MKHPRIRTKDGVFIYARYTPGFEADLTSWELIISGRGKIHQSLDASLPVAKRERVRTATVAEDLLVQWLAQAEALDFEILAQLEKSIITEDTPTYTLAFPDIFPEKSISLRNVDMYVIEGNPHMRAFRLLWEDIHAVAPFESTRRFYVQRNQDEAKP
jgi:hypothetical protein